MTITCIRNARLRGKDFLFDIHIDGGGLIAKIEPASGSSAARPADGELDAGGNLVMPSLIDSHLHLDLAYTLDLCPKNKSGTLVEAIRLWSEYKKTMSAESVKTRALRAVRTT